MSEPSPQGMTIPPALRPGDGVSIVAPASSPKRAAYESAMAAFTAAGYRPKTYRDFGNPLGYLSGTDDERAEELNQAFADPDTSMVLAVRGGYGAGRMLDRIDWRRLTDRPKIVCGYSDLTALHAAIQGRCGLVSFHGPNLLHGFGDDSAATAAERAAGLALFAGQRSAGDDVLNADAALETLAGGAAEGPLVGGNLAVLTSLVGTPDEPDFDGAILLLEDTGEVPYRVDRLLTQLRAGGRLGRIAGAVLGYFSEADAGQGPAVDSVLKAFFEPLGVPVVAGAPVGHEHPNLPLPLGARVRLDADRGGLRLTGPVVRV